MQQKCVILDYSIVRENARDIEVEQKKQWKEDDGVCIYIIAKFQEEIPTYLCTGLIFLTDLYILAHKSVMFFTFDCHSAGLCSFTI